MREFARLPETQKLSHNQPKSDMCPSVLIPPNSHCCLNDKGRGSLQQGRTGAMKAVSGHSEGCHDIKSHSRNKCEEANLYADERLNESAQSLR